MPYVFCALAVFMDRRERLPRAAAAGASLAFVYAVWAMAGAGQRIVYWGFLLLVLGLPVYAAMARRARPAA